MGAGLMARRMSNGDGTRPKYDESKKLWRIDLTISDDGENKSRRSLYGKSEAEVKEKRDNLKADIKNGCLASSEVDKMTLGVWLKEWLEVYKKGKISNNTYSSYDNAIRLWISDKLKAVTLKKLRHSLLQKFINSLNKEFSSGTCEIIRVVLHQSLNVAVKNKYILNNPANGLEVAVTIKKEVVPLSKEELNLLLANRKGTKQYLYYVLSVYTGARIGEVLGLSWDDIDLKNNIIHIRHSLSHNGQTMKWEIGTTKTGKGRDIPIMPILIDVIKHHKAEQSKIKLQAGLEYNKNNMVFCNQSGGYVNQASIRLALKNVIKSLGITRNITPHTLRHTFVSQMISAGINIKLISTMVGHANINITLDTYGHLMPGDTIKAMEALTKQMEDIAI